jgi:NAD(P)-dependent dehydrogenase (short-subunit alcohol dehydrogenase family)
MSRVAVVTGGASGIGRATAALLTGRGFDVVVFDKNGEFPVDVSDADSVARAMEELGRSFGPVKSSSTRQVCRRQVCSATRVMSMRGTARSPST